MNKYTASMVGLAMRAGKAHFGLDAIRRTKDTKLIMYDGTLSVNSENKAIQFAKIHSIAVIKLPSIQQLTHKSNCKIIGIADINFAQAIILRHKEEEPD